MNKLEKYISTLDVKEVSIERLAILQPLIDYISSKNSIGQISHLNFICTHNSRRSQISQIWAQVAADHFDVDAITYSGGVEVTAFNERAVASIQRTGLKVIKRGEVNPTYLIDHSVDHPVIVTYSKKHDDPINPTSNFAAVMTCSHADDNCPLIIGAEARIPVLYIDPKVSDDTTYETATYDERVRQIATEMFYVFKEVCT